MTPPIQPTDEKVTPAGETRCRSCGHVKDSHQDGRYDCRECKSGCTDCLFFDPAPPPAAQPVDPHDALSCPPHCKQESHDRPRRTEHWEERYIEGPDTPPECDGWCGRNDPHEMHMGDCGWCGGNRMHRTDCKRPTPNAVKAIQPLWPGSAAQPVERVAMEAEALAGKIIDSLPILLADKDRAWFKSIARVLCSEALAARDAEHVRQSALLMESVNKHVTETLAVKDRERGQNVERLSAGLFKLSPPNNPTFTGDAVESALAWIAALQADLAITQERATQLEKERDNATGINAHLEADLASVREERDAWHRRYSERNLAAIDAENSLRADLAAAREERAMVCYHLWPNDGESPVAAAKRRMADLAAKEAESATWKARWTDAERERVEVADRADAAEARVREAEGLLRDIRDNYDCDASAHHMGRADTSCRCCKARAFLTPADEKGGPTCAHGFLAGKCKHSRTCFNAPPSGTPEKPAWDRRRVPDGPGYVLCSTEQGFMSHHESQTCAVCSPPDPPAAPPVDLQKHPALVAIDKYLTTHYLDGPWDEGMTPEEIERETIKDVRSVVFVALRDALVPATPEPPDPPAAPPAYHYVAVTVTLTRLIREHLQNCIRTIRNVDCPDLDGIVLEWARKIATEPPVPATPEPSKPPCKCGRIVRPGWTCPCGAERVVGEAGTVEKLTPLAREVFPMAAAIEAGTVGGKHEFVMPHGKGDTCAFWCKADFESPASYCGKPAADTVHEVSR
jgi:FtsZ-binding cell division protein ZapB